jgi:hypothetical protein
LLNRARRGVTSSLRRGHAYAFGGGFATERSLLATRR